MPKIEFIEQETSKILQAFEALDDMGVIVDISPIKLDTSAYCDIFGPVYHRRSPMPGLYDAIELTYKGVTYWTYAEPGTKYYEIKNKDWGE